MEVNLWEWAIFAPAVSAPTCRLEGNWLRSVWRVSYPQGLTKGARRPQQRWPPEVQISLKLPVGETALFMVSELQTRILSWRSTRSSQTPMRQSITVTPATSHNFVHSLHLILEPSNEWREEGELGRERWSVIHAFLISSPDTGKGGKRELPRGWSLVLRWDCSCD